MGRVTLATLLSSLLLSLSSALSPPFLLKWRGKHIDAMRGHIDPAIAVPPDQYYNQTLDHFDPLNNGFWRQRYWVNASMWKGADYGAPVFFYVEGEAAGSPYDTVQVSM